MVGDTRRVNGEQDQGFEFGPVRPRARKRVADRPHGITIALAILGPLVTVLAVGIGALSLRTSQQALMVNQTSMKVAQRAYLVLRNGESEFRHPARFPVNGFAGLSSVGWGFEIHNIGRSPATVLGHSVRVFTPPLWTIQPLLMPWLTVMPKGTMEPKNARVVPLDDGAVFTELDIGEVPQEGSIEGRRGSATFYLGEDQMAEVSKRDAHNAKPSGGIGRMEVGARLTGSLLFRDVFGDTHKIRWCWVAMEGATTPRNCDSEYFAMFGSDSIYPTVPAVR